MNAKRKSPWAGALFAAVLAASSVGVAAAPDTAPTSTPSLIAQGNQQHPLGAPGKTTTRKWGHVRQSQEAAPQRETSSMHRTVRGAPGKTPYTQRWVSGARVSAALAVGDQSTMPRRWGPRR